jgi:hypothetical protein
MKLNLPFLLLVLLLASSPLHAEDWTTIDGKIYRDVQVVKSEPDAITIVYRDGGALVPLAKLPTDLQKRFDYDPIKAEAAADERVRSDAASAAALQVEKQEATDLEKKVQARQMAEQQAARAYFLALTTSYQGVDLGSKLMDPNLFQEGNVWGHLKTDPIPHYQVSDIATANPFGLAAPASLTPSPANFSQNTTALKPTASAPSDLSDQLNAHKIRLIGKVRAAVAGGYILGSIAKDDNYSIDLDPSRPDYELVSDHVEGGGIFLLTRCTTYSQNQILDVDVYPMSKYTSATGETMPAFTTNVSMARACLALKQHD